MDSTFYAATIPPVLRHPTLGSQRVRPVGVICNSSLPRNLSGHVQVTLITANILNASILALTQMWMKCEDELMDDTPDPAPIPDEILRQDAPGTTISNPAIPQAIPDTPDVPAARKRGRPRRNAAVKNLDDAVTLARRLVESDKQRVDIARVRLLQSLINTYSNELAFQRAQKRDDVIKKLEAEIHSLCIDNTLLRAENDLLQRDKQVHKVDSPVIDFEGMLKRGEL